jgi:hypothetical protein
MSRVRCLSALFAVLLRGQAATWRVESEGLAAFDAALAAGRPLLAAFWHGQYFPLFALLRGRQATIFTSRCFRGAVIEDLCRRFGYRGMQIPVGGRALKAMRSALTSHPVAAIAADGPLGPHQVFKPGAVRLASQLGLAVFPVAVDASRKRVAAARWDRRETPRLGSRVAMVIGAPLTVPADLDAAGVHAESLRLASALAAARRRATELVGAGPEAVSTQDDDPPWGGRDGYAAEGAAKADQQPVGVAEDGERHPHLDRS